MIWFLSTLIPTTCIWHLILFSNPNSGSQQAAWTQPYRALTIHKWPTRVLAACASLHYLPSIAATAAPIAHLAAAWATPRYMALAVIIAVHHLSGIITKCQSPFTVHVMVKNTNTRNQPKANWFTRARRRMPILVMRKVDQPEAAVPPHLLPRHHPRRRIRITARVASRPARHHSRPRLYLEDRARPTRPSIILNGHISWCLLWRAGHPVSLEEYFHNITYKLVSASWRRIDWDC